MTRFITLLALGGLLLNASPTLAVGRDEIRLGQFCLTVLGFTPGPIDGVLGRQTIAAILRYAQHRGVSLLAAESWGTLLAIECLPYMRARQSRPAATLPVFSQ
jgi:peptidoglycan hydrolase-like protein with peptidoglycan-binding domain